MGPTRRDSVPEILEPAIGDLARSIEAPTRSSSRELTLGGRNASGEIVLRRTDGTVAEAARGTDDTVPGLLARGSGPIGSSNDDVAIIHAPKVEVDSRSLFSAAPTIEIDITELESKRVAVAAKVRANAEPEVELVDDLLMDPWFFKTEEEIAAIEDDPTARIIEIKIAPVLDHSAFDDDRWVF